jgi:hypothetical protein
VQIVSTTVSPIWVLSCRNSRFWSFNFPYLCQIFQLQSIMDDAFQCLHFFSRINFIAYVRTFVQPCHVLNPKQNSQASPWAMAVNHCSPTEVSVILLCSHTMSFLRSKTAGHLHEQSLRIIVLLQKVQSSTRSLVAAANLDHWVQALNLDHPTELPLQH